MIVESLRFRLQLWHGALLVLVLVGFAFTAYRAASADQTRRISEELDARMEDFFRPPFPVGEPPPPPEARGPAFAGPMPFGGRAWMDRLRTRVEELSSQTAGYYYVVYQEDGTILAKTQNTPAELPSRMAAPSPPTRPSRGFRGPRPPGQPITRAYARYRDVYRDLPGGEAVAVGRSIDADEAALRRLMLSFAFAGAGLLLFGLAGGWWLTSRAMRPIDVISETATKIAAGDLSQRIPSANSASELDQLVQVLNSTFDRLQSSFDRQSRFTSDASHELRTPISVMLSQIQLTLSRERTPSEYRDALHACQRAVQRMRRLTESLLVLARMDAGEEPLQRQRFDLTELVRDCVELSRPMAWENDVEFLCDLPHVEAVGDEDRLAQVILNLASNAIHFNTRGGKVRISVTRSDNSAQIKVSDTGPGIAGQDLPHIFERFYRADKSRSKSHGSSGLGLSICQSIVAAHGGSIDVHTVAGEGTTFVVTLPDAPDAPSLKPVCVA